MSLEWGFSQGACWWGFSPGDILTEWIFEAEAPVAKLHLKSWPTETVRDICCFMLLRSGVRHYAAVESTVMVKELAMWPWGRALYAEGTACAKALTWEHGWLYMGQQGGQCARRRNEGKNRRWSKRGDCGQIIWETSRLLELTLALIWEELVVAAGLWDSSDMS